MDRAGFHQAAGLEPTLPEPEQAAGADDPDPPDISVRDVLLPFKEAVGFFSRYLRCKLRLLVRHNEVRSLPMTVECSSSQDHEGLCEDFQSGHLNSVAQEMLRTPQVLEKLGVTELKTFTAEYQCEKGTKLSEASSGNYCEFTNMEV